MRHHNSVRKFGRPSNQRKALLNSLARSLVLAGRIETSEAKAKELRPLIEKMVTKSITPTVAKTRTLVAKIGADAEKKLRETISPKYKDQNGGYTRIIKLSQVRTDASKQAVIEFI